MKKLSILIVVFLPLLLFGGLENPPGTPNPMTGDLDGGGNQITNLVSKEVYSFALSDTNLLYVDFIPNTQFAYNISNVSFWTHGGTRAFHLVDRVVGTTDPESYTLILSNLSASATFAVSNVAYEVSTGRVVSAIIQEGTGTNLVVSLTGNETK